MDRLHPRRDHRRLGEDAEDLRDQDYYWFAVELDELLACGKFEWAAGTLRTVRDRVETTHQVTTSDRLTVQRVLQARRPIHDYARRWPWPID